jgi:hypothetical protein
MKQIFDQFLQFLQQGIAAIFRFVRLIWSWSIDQITKVTHAPWDHWPIWKQVLLVVLIAAVAYFLFIAARQLWYAGVRVLSAFAGFLVALVTTLPAILIAGVVSLGGLWVINNINLSSLPTINLSERGDDAKKPPPQTTGQGTPETTGSTSKQR